MVRFEHSLFGALLITACSPAPLPSGAEISGQLELPGPWPDAVSFIPIEILPQARTPVAADGTFRLPLPAAMPPDGTIYGDPTCEGMVLQRNPQAAFATLPTDRLNIWRQGHPSGTVTTRKIQSGVVKTYQYVYATAATTVHGVQTCGGSQETFELDYDLGWNLVEWINIGGRQFEFTSVPNQRLIWRSIH
ncbi:hypothetical protein [Deinococcus hopiensis]|uniref:Lipoprotein n=1 Tax=Deinococcus hopiensis KR-140 TaxID=695939 RepID=A0A1W1UAM4_9DEIO|nr:hypothetical protein [Deinococcus hopiensis]SMB78158.1 hypothetical protein SAMN00790413_06516 [Deinococcus hopiensis KR-140]